MRSVMKLAISTLAALSLQTWADQPPASGSDTGQATSPTYAKLEKTQQGFRFTAFSETYSENAPWVRLSDGQPMWSVDTEYCATGLMELTNHRFHCDTAAKELFRTKALDVSPSGIITYLTATYLTYGVFAAIPPARVSFDQAAFQSAYQEAFQELAHTRPAEMNPELPVYAQVY